MTNENHENDSPGDGSGDMAIIGEGTANEKPVSVQLLQDIYHELTGKSEDISKTYTEGFQIKQPDLDQLNHRIAQACEQYNICSSNCSVKVFFLNDTQQTYSSYEKFAAFNAGSTAIVESVLFEYNFLVLLPKLNKPQPYSLSIRVASGIAIQRRMRKEMPIQMPKILKIMRGRTGIATVKYVDYTVARTLLDTVDTWFQTLTRAPSSKYIKWLQKRSEHLPFVSRYISSAIVASIIFLQLTTLLPTNASNFELARFLLIAFFALFATYKIAHHLGRAAENSIDRMIDLSFVQLTAGDKNEIQEAKTANKKSGILAAVKFVASIVIVEVVRQVITIMA